MTKSGKKKFEKKEDLKKDNIVVQKAMTLSILYSRAQYGHSQSV